MDQITAVDNFIAFKKLMVKRNTELNEQAMKMINGESDPKQVRVDKAFSVYSLTFKPQESLLLQLAEVHRKLGILK